MTNPKPTVFLVDDDHAVRDAMELLLDTAGFNTVSFASATEFLERYNASQPGCLVLDICAHHRQVIFGNGHFRKCGTAYTCNQPHYKQGQNS